MKGVKIELAFGNYIEVSARDLSVILFQCKVLGVPEDVSKSILVKYGEFVLNSEATSTKFSPDGKLSVYFTRIE